MIESREWGCVALGRRCAYSIFVPDEPPPARGWPVVLLLHGAGRNHRTVIDAPALRADIEQRRFVIVFPNGELSFYLHQHQSMLTELLTLVGPVERQRVGVCGWSMGGFGAVRFAEDCPEKIAAVGSLIGLLDYPNPALPAAHNYDLAPVMGTEPADWQAINCLAGAERLRGQQIRILGARQAFDFQMNQNFHERLEALGINHGYEILTGAHDWPTVQRGLPLLLDFMASALLIIPTGKT